MARDALGEPPPSIEALSLTRITLAAVSHRFDEEELDYHLATLDYLDAAAALHRGNGARADSLMGTAVRLATNLFQWDRMLSDISARHARRLLRDGDARRAATWFRRAANAADERGLPPRDRAAYHLEYAGAAYDDGRGAFADSVVTAIEKLHRRQLDDRLRSLISTLRAARARDTGDPGAARRIAGAAVTQWHAFLSSRTPHAAAYALLESGDRLRRLCRDLFADSPADRYAIDMTWRSTRQVLGRDFRSDDRIPDGETFLNWLRKPASAPWWSEVRNAIDDGTVGAHIVYAEMPSVVLRWIHRISGVSEDTLRIAPDDPNRMHALLPDDAFQLGGDQNRRAILISAEGSVATMPFARALDENGTYLIEHADVVWAPVLEGAKSDPPRRGTRLSVSDPRLPFELALGYSPIDGSTIADALSERSASARHLTGAEATKSMVMGTWARSPVVVLSGSSHPSAATVAAPWLMATPRVSPLSLDRAVLDVVDVRGADFSGCQFVGVIGAPSGAGLHLDQAFLDAGARSVLVARDIGEFFDPAAFIGDVAIASDRPGLSVAHAVSEIQRAWRQRLDPDRVDPKRWNGIAIRVSDMSPLRATISPFR
jgi:hypothetical protein